MNTLNQDIRWQQRFSNFKKAFAQLEKFIAEEDLNELEAQGLIKAFEYTYELSWKTLQDLLKDKGYKDIIGPRPVIEQSFQDGYIRNGEAWMRMHNSRNLTSHTYNQDTADEIVEQIIDEYYNLFKELLETLEEERSGKQSKLFNDGK
jgi:nucleotidyltransferase substrate binding protein (TIGR01987 family)